MRRLFFIVCTIIGAGTLIALWPRTPNQPPTAAPLADAALTAPAILSTDPIRGPREAPLTIVEFSDFTCPACAQVQPILIALQQEYGTRLRLVWKDAAHLDHLTDSRRLHIAARCAQQQGRFWEFHDVIFQAQPNSDAALSVIANGLKLDLAAFSQCMKDVAAPALVDDGMREAKRLDVAATPAFFVNGARFTGNPSADAFRALLKNEKQ